MDNKSKVKTLKQSFYIGHLQVVAIIFSRFVQSDNRDFAILHNHKNFELRLVSGSDATIYAGGEFYPVRDGDIFITPPLIYHYYIVPPHSSSSYRSFSFYFIEDGTPQGADELNHLMDVVSAPVRFTDQDHWVDILFNRIRQEFDGCQPGYMSRVSALLASLILTTMQYLLPDKDVQWNNEYSLYNNQQELMIERFFAEEFRNNISIADLANLLHVSSRQVNRILNNLYKCSFTQKLTEVRIERVKLAITLAGKHVLEAAFENGFHSLPHFYTAFHKYCGCSPSQYIKQHREKALPPRLGASAESNAGPRQKEKPLAASHPSSQQANGPEVSSSGE